MTFKKLAKLIAEREGKKSQTKIADVREILGLLSSIEAELILSGNPDSIIQLLAEQTHKKLAKAKKRKA